MKQQGLLDLPSELLLQIVILLPVPDILRCRQLCQLLNNILSSSVELQYKIELFCSRQCDLPNVQTGLSVSDRLSALRNVNKNWENLTFTRHTTLDYPFPSSYVYELSGGRLVLGSGATAGRNGTTGLDIYDLPDRDMQREAARRRMALHFPIADFAMDVTQNLLILLERTLAFGINLHLYTFDTNILHPDAKQPVLHMPNQKWVTVHVAGPLLVCLFAENVADVLVVWNWKTGEQIAQLAGTKLQSFTLLSSDSFAVANLDQESLDVFVLDVEGKTIKLLQRLQLPRVLGDADPNIWTYDHALLRSYPNPQHPLQPTVPLNDTTTQTHLPFITDNEDGIIICTFHSVIAEDSFTLVTHRSALRHVYNEHLPPMEILRNGVREKTRIVPWSDWGPDHVRWIDVQCSMRWICYVHGHRIVALERKEVPAGANADDSSEEENDAPKEQSKDPFISPLLMSNDMEELLIPYALRILDFNPLAVRKAESEAVLPKLPPNSNPKERVGRGQLLVTEETVSKGKIVTQLPYLDTTIKLRHLGLGEACKRTEGVMMNGDCIIVMLANRNWQTEGVEVFNV